MSDRMSRNIKRKQSLRQMTNDVLRSARVAQPTQHTVMELFRTHRDKILGKHSPRWLESYAQGLQDLMHDVLISDMVHCYTYQGKVYSSTSTHPSYYGKHGITPEEMSRHQRPHGFYWADSIEPGQAPKRFY